MISGAPFDEQHLRAVCTAVQRGHELVFGLEGDRVDARIRGLFGVTLHAQLVGERVQRTFGRVALDLPLTVRLEQLGVVAEKGVSAQQFEQPTALRRLLLPA